MRHESLHTFTLRNKRKKLEARNPTELPKGAQDSGKSVLHTGSQFVAVPPHPLPQRGAYRGLRSEGLLPRPVINKASRTAHVSYRLLLQTFSFSEPTLISSRFSLTAERNSLPLSRLSALQASPLIYTRNNPAKYSCFTDEENETQLAKLGPKPRDCDASLWPFLGSATSVMHLFQHRKH